MIFVVSFGISQFHGSELAVGWQWFRRTRSLGDVRFIAHRAFQSPAFVAPEIARDIVFLGAAPKDINDVNVHHRRFAYKFWMEVRRYLCQHATPADVLVIVSPAAVWFLPFVSALPIRREHVFYGPLGVNQVEIARCGSRSLKTRMAARNLQVRVLRILWRILASAMPRNLSFRFDSEWFARRLGRKFHIVGTLPEVEAVSAGPSVPEDCYRKEGQDALEVLVVADDRSQKNTGASIEFAVVYATQRLNDARVVLLGLSPEEERRVSMTYAGSGVTLDCRPKMGVTAFRSYLAHARPTVVSLSLSEGMPSLLIEALISGCEVLAYAVGGIPWLERFGQSAETVRIAGWSVRSIRWNASSYEAYRNFVAGLFEHMLEAIGASRTEACKRISGSLRPARPPVSDRPSP